MPLPLPSPEVASATTPLGRDRCQFHCPRAKWHQARQEGVVRDATRADTATCLAREGGLMGWSEQYLDAPFDHVFVRCLGEVDDGATPIVLLHGFTDSGECWYPAVPALARRGRIALPDGRGHGRSGTPDEATTIDALAAD